MKILTYNVRSWYRDTANGWANWRKRADRIRATIKDAAPDVLLLQESLPPMTARLLPDGYHAAGCSISHHVFVRDGFAEVERAGWHLRWCWALLRLPNAKRVAVVCVHTRWEQSIREATAKAISTLRTGDSPIIAGGDWNNEPEVMRLPLFPLYIAHSGEKTYYDWADGAHQMNLDWFALSGIAYDRISLPVIVGRPIDGYCDDSDHLPVMLEAEL